MRALLVVLALGACLTNPAAGQHKKGHCTGEAPDSAWQRLSPVYRDCDVDRAAEETGIRPRLSYTPSPHARTGCLRAEFEFVIDTLGSPELGTVRARRGNDRDLEEAVRSSLSALHYAAAVLDGRPVRQLVVFKQSMAVMAIVSVNGRPSEPIAPRPPPGCN